MIQAQEELVSASDQVRGLDDGRQCRLRQKPGQRLSVRRVQRRDLLNDRRQLVRVAPRRITQEREHQPGVVLLTRHLLTQRARDNVEHQPLNFFAFL